MIPELQARVASDLGGFSGILLSEVLHQLRFGQGVVAIVQPGGCLEIQTDVETNGIL